MVGKMLISILFPFLGVLMARGRPATTSEQSRASGKPWRASRHEVIRCPAEELRVRTRIKVGWETSNPCRIFSFCRGRYDSGEGAIH